MKWIGSDPQPRRWRPGVFSAAVDGASQQRIGMNEDSFQIPPENAAPAVFAWPSLAANGGRNEGGCRKRNEFRMTTDDSPAARGARQLSFTDAQLPRFHHRLAYALEGLRQVDPAD